MGVRASRKQSGGVNNFTMRPGHSTAAEMSRAERDILSRELKQAEDLDKKVKAIDESHKIAMRMVEEGRYEEAEKAFRRVAELQPTLSPTWANLGHVYTKLKRPSDAVTAYRRAIDLDPGNATLYQDLGHVYSDMGDSKKATEMYEKGAQLAGSQDPKKVARSQYFIAVGHLNSGRNLEAMEALLKQHHERIAGIIVEPMPNAGGMVPPAPGYLRGLRALADKYGVLLLFDEIVTLRLSSGGFQAIEGVTPDLTAVGKIIGGGFPVGAFGGRKDIMELFNPAASPDFVFHSGTFNGNNMTTIAGLQAMQRLDKAAIERINRLGESLGAGINRVLRSLGIRAQCLGYGSLQQIHWTDDRIISLADARRAGEDTHKLRQLLHLELLNRGVYTSNRGMFSISTPMNEDDVALALAALEGALNTLKPYMRAVAPRLLRD